MGLGIPEKRVTPDIEQAAEQPKIKAARAAGWFCCRVSYRSVLEPPAGSD